MSARLAVIFGQFGAVADPVNLPHFRDRIDELGIETILVQHTDTQKVYDFLHGFAGFGGIVGASLGAGIAPVIAGYLRPQVVHFVGGFQPSDYDPVMHAVSLETDDGDLITRAVMVPDNVRESLCFRNPVAAATGGLGHATYLVTDRDKTKLTVVNRPDVHPGDFGVAQDQMTDAIRQAVSR